jgi:hypothetical protein
MNNEQKRPRKRGDVTAQFDVIETVLVSAQKYGAFLITLFFGFS